jgi:hypothetical protein
MIRLGLHVRNTINQSTSHSRERKRIHYLISEALCFGNGVGPGLGVCGLHRG